MLLDYASTFESIAHEVHRVDAAHGESFQLIAKVTTAGLKRDLDEYVILALYQPDCQSGENEVYYLLDTKIDKTGRAVIEWNVGRELEGEDNYRIWLMALFDDELSYPAIWDLHLRSSPGASPIITPDPPPASSSASAIFTDIVFTPALAPEFSPQVHYTEGKLTSRNGWLYKAIRDHEGNWSDEDFVKITISEAVSSQASQIFKNFIKVRMDDGNVATFTHDDEHGWHFNFEDGSSSSLITFNGLVESSSLAAVAFTGNYNDLNGKPSIPEPQVNADWNASSGVSEIKNKPNLTIYAEKSSLASVAFDGDYTSLKNKPSIPEPQVNADWSASSGIAEILNKPDLTVYAEKSSLASAAFTGNYGDLKNTPNLDIYVESSELADVAFNGDYLSLKNKPDLTNFVVKSSLASVGFTGNYNDLLEKPDLTIYAEKSSLASVAISGNYEDLKNKPSIPNPQVNADWSASSGIAEILNKPNLDIYAEKSSLASVATTGNYNDLQNKPSIPEPQVNADWNAPSGVAEVLNKPDLTIYAEKSSLASVAFDGDYTSLKNKPSIPDPQVNADWNASSGVGEILNKPDLSIYAEKSSMASVAFTGEYSNLKNKPDLTIYAEKSSLASVAFNGDYTSLQNKPQIPFVVNVTENASSGEAADALSVWNLIGDIEGVLYFINYGSSSGGEP